MTNNRPSPLTSGGHVCLTLLCAALGCSSSPVLETTPPPTGIGASGAAESGGEESPHCDESAAPRYGSLEEVCEAWRSRLLEAGAGWVSPDCSVGSFNESGGYFAAAGSIYLRAGEAEGAPGDPDEWPVVSSPFEPAELREPREARSSVTYGLVVALVRGDVMPVFEYEQRSEEDGNTQRSAADLDLADGGRLLRVTMRTIREPIRHEDGAGAADRSEALHVFGVQGSFIVQKFELMVVDPRRSIERRIEWLDGSHLRVTGGGESSRVDVEDCEGRECPRVCPLAPLPN